MPERALSWLRVVECGEMVAAAYEFSETPCQVLTGLLGYSEAEVAARQEEGVLV